MEALVRRSRLRSSPRPGHERGEPGLEQLKNEMAATDFRLRSAEQTRAGLEKLLVPIEQVRRELTNEQRRSADAFRENERLFTECKRLTSRVAELEAKLAEPKPPPKLEDDGAARQAETWRLRALQLERDLAKATSAEGLALSELVQARSQAKALAAQVVDLSGARSEIEDVLTQERASSQELAQEWALEKEALKEELSAQQREAVASRGQLCDLRTESKALQLSLARLQGQHDTLQVESSAQHQALCAAAEREGALLSRMESLEATAQAAAKSAMAMSRPALAQSKEPTELHIPAASCHDRSAVEQSEQRVDTVALIGPLLSEVRLKPAPPAPSSPRSRRDYPKGSHGRLARRIVLGLPVETALGEDLPRWEAANRERWRRLAPEQEPT